MIKQKLGLVPKDHEMAKLSDRARSDMVKEYARNIQMMERIDKPNSLLFQARLEAYLVESVDHSEQFGVAFKRMIEQYTTFIDGYIHHWHYLKWRLTSLSKS